MAMPEDTDEELVLSFLAVRQALGFLGLALPTVLYGYARVYGGGMQPSISEFYHTQMGDIFVGALWAIGIFLLSYKGYDKRPPRFRIGDRGASIAAGLGAIGTALFPVSREPGFGQCRADLALTDCLPDATEPVLVTGLYSHADMVHYGFAGLFLLSLAYFCLVLFPMGGDRTEDDRPALTKEHLTYYTCGWLILAAIAALVVYFLLPPGGQADLVRLNYIFWWETVAVFAFAISWLTKGKVLIRPFGLNIGRG